jgi:hypothetical protein
MWVVVEYLGLDFPAFTVAGVVVELAVDELLFVLLLGVVVGLVVADLLEVEGGVLVVLREGAELPVVHDLDVGVAVGGGRLAAVDQSGTVGGHVYARIVVDLQHRIGPFVLLLRG